MGASVLAVAALVAALLAPLSGASAAEQPAAVHEPRLLFDGPGLDVLRNRIAAGGVPADAWASLRRKADAYTDPASPSYADPSHVDPIPDVYPNLSLFEGIAGQNEYGTILSDLGMAYAISREPRYGRHAIELLLAIERSGWWAWSANQLGQGDLSKGVALAFDWVRDLLTEQERNLLVSSLAAHLPSTTKDSRFNTRQLFSCLDPDWNYHSLRNNWVGVCGGGTGLLLLALEGEPGMPADLDPWLAMARLRLLNHFHMYGRAGDGAEGAVYAAYGLHNALPFAFAYQRLRGEDILDLAPQIRELPSWLAYEQLPGEGTRLVPRNDSVYVVPMLHEVLPMYFHARPDGLSAWVWDHFAGPEGDRAYAQDVFAAPRQIGNFSCTDLTRDTARLFHCWRSPEVFTLIYYRSPQELPRIAPGETQPSSRWFPDFGLVAMRTGWGADPDDVVATFEAKHDQPERWSHFQEDVGSFTLFGYGAKFAVDSGYGHNYSCNDIMAVIDGCKAGGTEHERRTYSGRASGHNVVLVDDSARTQFAAAGLERHETITNYAHTGSTTLVESDLRTAYAPVSQFHTVPWAGRAISFTAAATEPVMLAVSDTLNRDGQPHGYQWRLHTDSANAVTTVGQTFSVLAPNGAAMTGAVAEADGPRTLWTAPFRHPALFSPVVKMLIQSDNEALGKKTTLDHLAVMAVTPPGEPTAAVSPVPATGGSAVEVTWPGAAAVFASRAHDAATVTTDRLSTDAAFLKVSPASGALSVLEGSHLRVDGEDHLSVLGSQATVIVSDGEVTVTGDEANLYRVRSANDPLSVKVNGEPVAWKRSGDHIAFCAGHCPDVVGRFAASGSRSR